MNRDRNARRFFLDVDEAGNVMITSPDRTAFDREDRNRFYPIKGDSSTPEGLITSLQFAGRMFRIEVTSWPSESPKASQ